MGYVSNACSKLYLFYYIITMSMRSSTIKSTYYCKLICNRFCVISEYILPRTASITML